MNDINSRAGTAIDLKLSNIQTFNRWKKEGADALARGDFKVKVSECEFLTSFLVCLKLLHSETKSSIKLEIQRTTDVFFSAGCELCVRMCVFGWATESVCAFLYQSENDTSPPNPPPFPQQ